MQETLRGQRVLVTGAAGFIGSHLVKSLVEMACHVTIIVRPGSSLWRIAEVVDRLTILEADLNSGEAAQLASSIATMDIIFHLAAAGVDQSFKDTATMVSTNILGTLRMLQFGFQRKVMRFIYCGSCFEYGCGVRLKEDSLPEPLSEYGASKSAAWILVHSFARVYGLPVVSLRPFTVFGPFEAPYRLIPHTIIKALNGRKIELTAGEQTRDFIYVQDVVEAFLIAAVAPEAIGSTFNICTGAATKVKDIVSQIVHLSENKTMPQFGALPYRDTEVWNLSGSPEKIETSLGWKARTNLVSGLMKSIQWFRENQHRYSIYA